MNTMEKIGLAVLALVLVAVWYFFPGWIQSHASVAEATKNTWSMLGTYGDSFGVLNSLMSSLAFLGVVATIYFQAKQFSQISAEQEKADRQSRQQTRLMALTAMLNHHNSQTDRFQEQMFHLLKNTSESGNPQKAFWMLSFQEHTEKGKRLIAELESLMASTENASN